MHHGIAISLEVDPLTGVWDIARYPAEFSNALLFESGEAELTERASNVFEPIAMHLVDDLEPAYGLVVEGYTDDVPIANSTYQSNWELSTAPVPHPAFRIPHPASPTPSLPAWTTEPAR